MKTTAFLLVWLAFPSGFSQIHFVDKKADGENPGVTSLRGAFTVGVSPGGKHLYAPGSLDHGLSVFSKDSFSGALTFVEAHVDGQGGITSLAGCRAAAVSPDGKHVYAAALTDGAVTVFSRNPTTGALTFVQAIFDLDTGGTIDGLGGAMAIAISPDGEHVYVGARSDDAIAAFTRDPGTGTLTLINVYKNLTPPILGLDGVEGLAMSGDGMHLYASAETDQAVTAFSRNPTTGALTFIDSYFDGAGGIDGLGCVNNLSVSPDGEHVYAVGQFGAPSQPSCPVGFDDWMAIFARDTATGALSFLASLSPTDFNLPINCGGVAGDNGVVVSPNGEAVYATVQWQAAVVALRRNPANGMLTLDGFDCADLLDPDAVTDLISAHGLTTDPMGYRILVSALSPGTVIVYETGAYREFRFETSTWPIQVQVAGLVQRINDLSGIQPP